MNDRDDLKNSYQPLDCATFKSKMNCVIKLWSHFSKVCDISAGAEFNVQSFFFM